MRDPRLRSTLLSGEWNIEINSVEPGKLPAVKNPQHFEFCLFNFSVTCDLSSLRVSFAGDANKTLLIGFRSSKPWTNCSQLLLSYTECDRRITRSPHGIQMFCWPTFLMISILAKGFVTATSSERRTWLNVSHNFHRAWTETNFIVSKISKMWSSCSH